MFIRPMFGEGGPVYDPGMMTYDGSTGYYGKTGIISAGSNVTLVARFNVASFSGGSTQALIRINGGSGGGIQRMHVTLYSNDHATTANRNKMRVLSKNSAGTVILDLLSKTEVVNGSDHVLFCSYGAISGPSTFYIDSLDADDTGYASRVTSTGAMSTGGSSDTAIGSNNATAAVSLLNGRIGYIGYREFYLTNWSDFMSGSNPKELDETTWTEWGGVQPQVWNADGDLHTTNKGSLGLFTKNGTITGPT